MHVCFRLRFDKAFKPPSLLLTMQKKIVAKRLNQAQYDA